MSLECSILREKLLKLNNYYLVKKSYEWVVLEFITPTLVDIEQGRKPHRGTLEELKKFLRKYRDTGGIADEAINAIDLYLSLPE